jgi:P4 family phage/plasmid primase-like protien
MSSPLARSLKLNQNIPPILDTNTTMTQDTYIGSSLHLFLEDHRTTKGPKNEVSMTGMSTDPTRRGCWFVNDQEYPKFIELMHEYLFVKKLRPNNFIEQRRPDGATPLLVDLDFRYPTEKNLTRAFTTDHIQSFTTEIIAVLKEHFELKDRSQIRFFVTLRPQPYQDKKTKDVKDGVHIVSPDFILTPEHQSLLRYLLLDREAVKKSFENTGYTNKDEDVFDKSLMTKNGNGWFFYGESKPDIPAYSLSHVFKYNPKSGKIALENLENYDSLQLLKLLSIRHNLANPLLIQEKQKDIIQEHISKMNILVQQAITILNTPHQTPTNNELIGILPLLTDSFNNIVSSEDDIELAKLLAVECLSIDRADNYDTWMRAGWCLRNIDSSEEMFETWMKFSQKSSKFRDNNTEQLRRDWIKGTLRRVNGSPSLKMGSLKLWAREDNPIKYSEIIDGDIISFITKAALTFKGSTHYHVAKMVHKLFYDSYKCTVDGRSPEWYEFKDHTWNRIPLGIQLKIIITDDLAKKVDAAKYSLKAPDVNDADYNDKMEKYHENIGKFLNLSQNLFNANFKENVMKEAVGLFWDMDFYKKINQNPYLLGCANGILNLHDTVFDNNGQPVRYKATLSNGTATDYVTLKVGVTPDGKDPIEYRPYDPNDPIQEEIMNFFKKLFPDEELREYVLTLMAGCLEGANKEQCFYLMTGSGGNGKSKFVELMTGVLGQYAGSLSTTALTRKRPDSTGPNSDIMAIKSCRFIDMKEPDEGEPLNTARMKQFSGEDFVEARELHKTQERFKITGKIFLACNRMPPIYSMDGGTWRRIRVIPFDSRFVPASDPMVNPARHIYPRDDMLDERIKSWRVPFFSLLVHYYETKYCPNGIKNVPAVVMQASENYKGSYDSFGKFIASRIRREIGCENPPTFKSIWNTYKIWHQDQTGKMLKENEFKIRLNETYQAPADGKTYLHLVVFNSDEAIEDYDRALLEEQNNS